MARLTFSSADLDPSLSDDARFRLWRDLYTGTYGSRVDIYRQADVPFRADFQFRQVCQLGIATFRGTLDRIVRSRSDIAIDGSGDFFLGFNLSNEKMRLVSGKREADFSASNAVLCSNAEAGTIFTRGESNWTTVFIPHATLTRLINNPHDYTTRPIGADSSTVRFLRQYLQLLDGGLPEMNSALAAHIGETLTDLVALCFSGAREAQEIARVRGLPATRLQIILREIELAYANPAFSVELLAAKVGLSVRYVQDLLHRGGSSFSERVIELRLQHAARLLAQSHNHYRSVAEIAYASGFSDLSYFNRRFRARFGGTPSDFRSSRPI